MQNGALSIDGAPFLYCRTQTVGWTTVIGPSPVWHLDAGRAVIRTVRIPFDNHPRQAAFSQKLLEAIEPQVAVVFAEKDDRYRDLAAGVEEAWKVQVGVVGWHRTDLEGTVSFVSDGERLTVAGVESSEAKQYRVR